LINFRYVSFVICLSLSFSSVDHLVFNRITVKPNQAEMISIYNPTSQSVDLSDYYITDSASGSGGYYNLPSGVNYYNNSIFDFIVGFPNSLSIESQDSLIIGMSDTQSFADYYGYNPDLILSDMRDLINDAPVAGVASTIGGAAELGDSSEMLMLFKMVGNDNVMDVDYFIWGNAGSSTAINKTGVGSYLPDNSFELQTPYPSHNDGQTFVRLSSSSEGNEVSSGGNGITGNNETSEDFLNTWSVISTPEIVDGCTDSSAPNYNPNANTDDGTCGISIQEVYTQYGADICNGDLDNQSNFIYTVGLIVDYSVITNGPKILTIQDSEGYQLDVTVWDWDPAQPNNGYQEDISHYLDPYNSTQYYVVVYGLLGSYNCNFQLDASETGYGNVAINGSITYFDEIQTDGNYQLNPEIIQAKLDIAPYPFVPSSGERLDYSYSFQSDSRVIVRVFDISGRFVTSLVDRYFEGAGTVDMYNYGSDWDGRDHLGQIVSPGTYVMHLEAMNFKTGKASEDMAPIVVGVRP